MTRFGLSDQQLGLIQKAVSRFAEIESVVLFGSRAMGNYKAGSDIDIAVKGTHVNGDTISALSALLNEELPLPHFVDVVHYDTLNNPSLIKHINTKGAPL